MSTRARIGELLLARQLVDEPTLSRALAELPSTRRRLCSFLIGRGLIHPDDAVHALAEQHEMAGALQRHLTGRDPVLAKLLPAELARSWLALPIGRLRGGELIVCVRDPVKELIPELERATHGPVILAIAPASQLEALVASAYGPVPSGEFDVDLETGPIAVIDDETFRLVDLDDDRVAKMTQQIALEARTSPAGMPARSSDPSRPPELARSSDPSRPPEPVQRVWPPQPSRPPPQRPTEPSRPPEPRTMTPLPPRTTAPPPAQLPATRTIPTRPESGERRAVTRGAPPSARTTTPPLAKAPIALDFTLKAIERTQTRDDATTVAMAFAESRWEASLVLAIKEGAAIGHRGHGPNVSDDALQALAIPLTAPTIVKLAHDSRRIATDIPPGTGALQERLERFVGSSPLAAPIFVGSRVACVFVIGADASDALAGAELERLATALGVAYTRIVLDAKKS